MTEQNPGPGIARAALYNIRFYEKSPFNGSYRGMHYRIERAPADAALSTASEKNNGDGTATDNPSEPAETRLRVTVWPGPYNYDTTDDSRKVTAYFTFSNEGLDAVADYLNQYHKEHFA